MFGHMKFGVSDYVASKAFLLQALAPPDVTLIGEGKPTHGAEPAGSGDAPLRLYQSMEKPAPLYIAFRADGREQVDAFWQAALATGEKDNGAPRVRSNHHANYYAIFVIAPDGHNTKAVCHLAG